MDRVAAVAVLLAAGCAAAPPPQVPAKIANLRAIVFEGGIRLRWDCDRESAFQIERKSDGTWKAIGTTAGFGFEDATVLCDERVEYRVTPTGSPGATVLVHPLFRIAFRLDEEKNIVVQLAKRHRDLGWVFAQGTMKENDRIGWWDDGKGVTSVHTGVDGTGERNVEVDWNTGCVLKKIRLKETVYCVQPEYDRTWKQIGCRQRGSTHVLEAEVQDPYGQTKSFRSPRVLWDFSKEILPYEVPEVVCEYHRQYPSEPFLLQGADRAVEARRLLKEADETWDAKPDEAIAMYQKLLRDFADAPAVEEHRSRISRRVEQE